MADQTLTSWCAGCGTFHKADECPWKPAVSGIYEHYAPHVVAPNVNPHHHEITKGCTLCGGPHSVMFCPLTPPYVHNGGSVSTAVFKADPAVEHVPLKDTPVNPWDNQVGGQHYKKGIQPFEYAMANNLSSLEFSVVKYLRKTGDKAKRLEDLNKAKDCLEKLIWWEEHDGKI
ncbi:hypothetical protein Pondi_00070 [Escherichia phage Pondi]|nr:hypothetical protein Pondi_00070 [Escherichia phage Pondi]